MSLGYALSLAALLAGPGEPAAAGSLRVVHEPVECLLADAFPQIEARFEGGDVSSARVRFQGEGDQRWYSVAMLGRDGVYSAVLPRPKADLKRAHYVIEAMEAGVVVAASGERGPVVVEQSDRCSGKLASIAVSPALVSVEVPDGTRSLPKGFSDKNVAGHYASGRPVKGHPRTALFAVAAAGAAAAGLSLLKSDPAVASEPEGDFVRYAGGDPGPGGTVSLSRGSLSMVFEAFLSGRVPPGLVTVSLHPGPPNATPACVSLTTDHSASFEPRTAFRITVSTPYTAVDPACHAPFDVVFARVTFYSGGTPLIASGIGTIQDPSVNLHFEP